MLLALTCALCTVQPLPSTTTLDLSLPPPTLSLREAGPEAPLAPPGLPSPRPLAAPPESHAPLALASLPTQDTGSGDGEHSDHMSPMWIMMGVMVAVMVVGAGVYMMKDRSTPARPFKASALASPAMAAIPVVARGGG
jgi:hypothetical protein